ncbi:hypothetical protein SCA6_018406, partial [Theobroma cacao]
KGLIEKADAKLQDIIKRRKTATPNSWSIISAGYVHKNNMGKAFECFKEALAVQAQNRDWRPKKNGEVEDAEDFVKLSMTRFPPNRQTYHALLKGLLECMKDYKVDEDEETMKILSL